MLISAGRCLTLADPNQPGQGTVDKPLTSLPTVLGVNPAAPTDGSVPTCFCCWKSFVFFMPFISFGHFQRATRAKKKNDEFSKAKPKVWWQGGGVGVGVPRARARRRAAVHETCSCGRSLGFAAPSRIFILILINVPCSNENTGFYTPAGSTHPRALNVISVLLALGR